MELTLPQMSEFLSTYFTSEDRFNTLMTALLDAFSKSERALFVKEHKGEQCNGFRPRKWRKGDATFELKIPRTRSGIFQPLILSILREQDTERAKLFHELYTRGLTCEDISQITEVLYGESYSKQQVSHLSNYCREEIMAWLNRSLSKRYLAVYIDATFTPTRRDHSVSKEAYYSMLGVLPDGTREVLGVVNHPTEGAMCWEMELESLKERGVETVDLIISDALSGIEDAIARAFPHALHQLCVEHSKRQVTSVASRKDRAALAADYKEVFPLETSDVTPVEAFEGLQRFVEKWGRKYPSLKRLDNPRNMALFTYLRFPPHLQRMLYTTNWIERLNRDYKRTLRMRGAMPSPESVLFLLGSVAQDKTEGTYSRRLYQFSSWYIN